MSERVLADEAATRAFGEALARSLPAPEVCPLVIWLQGDLGAGKTTLCRAILRGLGWQGAVRSPTYTLMEPYSLPHRRISEVLHLDLYRLSDPAELEFLGLQDGLDQPALWLVEWPEKGRGYLPSADLLLTLTPAGEDARRLGMTVRPDNPHGITADLLP